MKDIIKKTADICKLIFGYGIMIVLFAGGLIFFGYLAALILGGEKAVTICTFIHKQYIPIIITISTSLILFGLFTMYLSGETALTPTKKQAPPKEKSGDI